MATDKTYSRGDLVPPKFLVDLGLLVASGKNINVVDDGDGSVTINLTVPNTVWVESASDFIEIFDLDVYEGAL